LTKRADDPKATTATSASSSSPVSHRFSAAAIRGSLAAMWA